MRPNNNAPYQGNRLPITTESEIIWLALLLRLYRRPMTFIPLMWLFSPLTSRHNTHVVPTFQSNYLDRGIKGKIGSLPI